MVFSNISFDMHVHITQIKIKITVLKTNKFIKLK